MKKDDYSKLFHTVVGLHRREAKTQQGKSAE